MAIVVEEQREKGGANWGGIAMTAMIFIILGVAVYYIFFKRPDLIEVVTPANFQNTVQISKIELKPEEVINDPKFKALQSYAEPLTGETTGTNNPFLGTF